MAQVRQFQERMLKILWMRQYQALDKLISVTHSWQTVLSPVLVSLWHNGALRVSSRSEIANATTVETEIVLGAAVDN